MTIISQPTQLLVGDSTQSWQQAILERFGPKRERMLLVIDPDNLMRGDALLAEMQHRDHDVVPLLDEATFRASRPSDRLVTIRIQGDPCTFH